MASVEEIQAKIIEPMRALFRVPFGIEDPERALLEYVRALKNVPGHLLEGAWERVVSTAKKRDWPTISEILLATGYVSDAKARADIPADKLGGLHASRVNPDPAMHAYAFYESSLRKDAIWSKFLDSIHPTAEHNFFVQVEQRGDGIEVPNKFRQEHIVTNYGEAMKQFFGVVVPVRVNPDIKYRALPVSTEASRNGR
jgi:hypothetical protein